MSNIIWSKVATSRLRWNAVNDVGLTNKFSHYQTRHPGDNVIIIVVGKAIHNLEPDYDIRVQKSKFLFTPLDDAKLLLVLGAEIAKTFLEFVGIPEQRHIGGERCCHTTVSGSWGWPRGFKSPGSIQYCPLLLTSST